MKHVRWIVGVLLVLGLAVAINRYAGEARAPRPPVVDASAPEAAIRSYWDLRDWIRRTACDAPGAECPVPSRVLASVVAGEALASFETRPGTRDPLAWSLLRVERVSDTQVNAFARVRRLDGDLSVITPAPIELFRSDPQTEFRYALARDDQGWKVREVWRNDPSGAQARVR